MNKLIVTAFLLLSSVASFSQGIKGYEFAEEGTIYLNDKDSIQGVLGFTYLKNNTLLLVGEKEVKYKSEDIRGFYLKTSKVRFVSGTFGLGYKAFLQVVIPGKKAMVVKTFVTEKGAKVEEGKEPAGNWSTSLYLVDKKINFENSKKIAEALKTECPELAAKLLKKDSGYFVGLMTVEDDMLAAYKKIIADLDGGCK